jgi:hypothetical protein
MCGCSILINYDIAFLFLNETFISILFCDFLSFKYKNNYYTKSNREKNKFSLEG